MSRFALPRILAPALTLLTFLALSPAPAPASTHTPKVDIYVTSWCPYCKRTMAYFQAKGIPFSVHDIENDPAAAKRFQEYHAQGVPLVIIDDAHINGYSVDAFDKAIDQH